MVVDIGSNATISAAMKKLFKAVQKQKQFISHLQMRDSIYTILSKAVSSYCMYVNINVYIYIYIYICLHSNHDGTTLRAAVKAKVLEFVSAERRQHLFHVQQLRTVQGP